MKLRHLALTSALVSSLALACQPKRGQPEAKEIISAPATPKLDAVSRAAFNRAAAELAMPLFWAEDEDADGALDPDELVVYWGLDPRASRRDYVKGGAFTKKLTEAYAQIVEHEARGAAEADPRRAAVKKELAQGRVTLVATDLSSAPAGERRFVSSIIKAAELVEALYAKQLGTPALAAKLPPGDLASKTLFFRNQGPKCQAPATERDPSCGALLAADMPKTKTSGLYPSDLLAEDEALCQRLQKTKDASLADPFTVVVKDGEGGLAAKPYHEVWAEDVSAIARELDAAAEALGESEPAMRAYLVAAAKAFRDGDWWAADEAWAKMDAASSRYYLRIGPDEVYAEPCSTKALYHVSFGLIDPGSITWQKKLDPLKAKMEQALAALAGPPYKARAVSFKLPDFVAIALNAGDSRHPFGATIGQALPNFGPVANEGRGRTVAMTNFYTDPDSVATTRQQAESLFCKETMTKWTNGPEAQLMSTILHEAAHNLGPSYQYKANGKTDREAFGGPLASTLEELKAQSAALYLADWLAETGELPREQADAAHVRDLFWAFGHISRGMYDEGGHPKNYSQLAAIQLGWLMKEGAVTWRAEERAANGEDAGCFAIDFGNMPAAVEGLMREVAQIKAKGDKRRAERLVADFVDVTGDLKKVHDVVAERVTRAPKPSFVYAIHLGDDG